MVDVKIACAVAEVSACFPSSALLLAARSIEAINQEDPR